jgi:dihydrofolate reductase
MRINAVVAMAENRVIGNHNKLPWHMPADLQHFKALTSGKPIIMGRKTYESIGRPLPDRCNIVISHNTAFQAAGCVVVHSVDAALAAADYSDDIFIIGGALLYEHMLPRIERIYMTVINGDFAGDAYFPPLPATEWVVSEDVLHQADAKNPHDYRFITYDRVTAARRKSV